MHWMLLLSFIGFIILGLGAGTLSGLLGAGGGLLVVPGLALIFRFSNTTPSIQMHMAIGTSLATMIVVAIRSLCSHMRHEVPFFDVYKRLAPGLVMGVIGGGIVAHFIHSQILSILFGIFVFIMAYSLYFDKKITEEKKLPHTGVMLLAGWFVGMLSGLLGVAGSAFSVPFLVKRGVNIHIAVVVSVAIAVTVSILGTITYTFTGLHAAGLPMWSTGYIYWPAWLGIVLGGVVAAPLGAALSYRIPDQKLKRYFSFFLIVVGVDMLWPR